MKASNSALHFINFNSLFTLALGLAFLTASQGCATTSKSFHRDPAAQQSRRDYGERFNQRYRGPGFEDIYSYASRPANLGGLSLMVIDARDFAERVLQMSDPDSYFHAHQEAFRYASRPLTQGGLQLALAEARRFADEIADRPDTDRYIEKHMAALAYARESSSLGGLEMTPAEARNFADQMADHPKLDEDLHCLREQYGFALNRLNQPRADAYLWAEYHCGHSINGAGPSPLPHQNHD